MVDPGIDLDEVRREIDEEVRARRAAGEYPPGFERELDALFAQFAPPEASDDFDTALERAEEAVAIEPVIPIASRNPLLLIVKRVMSKLIGWYHVWLAQQVTTLGATITHALRLLGGRVDALERAAGSAERVRAAGASRAPVRDDAVWQAVVVDALRAVEGRVAVAECGDGELVAALTGAGVDAYGIEPRAALADAALARGLEVRVDDAPGHLQLVAPDALAGVVLRACVERLTTGELLDLAERAVRAIRAGGRVVVCSLTPAVWGEGATAVEADLAPGRPLRAATWAAVLEEHGCDKVAVHELASGGAYVVVAARP